MALQRVAYLALAINELTSERDIVEGDAANEMKVIFKLCDQGTERPIRYRAEYRMSKFFIGMSKLLRLCLGNRTCFSVYRFGDLLDF